MSDSWVSDRMQAGELPRPGESADQYVEAFVEYRLRKLSGADTNGTSYDAERARLVKEQADRIATANARERGELASLPDITMAMLQVIEISKARLARVPAIIAKGDDLLRQRVETALHDALDELSSTRIREIAGGGVDEEDAPEEED